MPSKLLLLRCLAVGIALGAVSASAVAPALTLSEAEIIKVQWDTRDLTAADLDGDDRQDLAVINNEEARIDLYYQLAPGVKPGQTERKTSVGRWEPVLEDARFERVKVLTGGIAYDLAFGDLNHDQRPDLVYNNDRDEVVVHFQGEQSDWTTKKYVEFEDLGTDTGTLWIGDLRQDGKNDLLCVTETGLMIFPDGDVETRPHRYTNVNGASSDLNVCDLNDDGRLDLVYHYPSSGGKSVMTVRFQSEDGRFVGERFFEHKQSANAPQPLNWGQEGKHSFIAISEANRTVVQLTAGPVTAETADKKRDFKRTAYAVPSVGGKESFYAMADFTGDGRLDVVASDGPGAQVWLFQQTAQGTLSAPVSFPAFSDINGLAAGDLDGDGRAELIMVSAKEGVLGVTRVSKEQRFAYPEVVPLPSKPEMMTVGDLDGDGTAEIVCAVEGESNRTKGLVTVKHDSANEGWIVASLLEDDEEIGARMEGLRLADINQDGDTDVLVLSSVQPLEVILRQVDGSFKAVDGGAAGLADKVEPRAITLGDLNGDGRAELLVTRDTFARSAKLGLNGRSEVMDQINAPDVSASLLASVVVDLDADGKPELLLVDGQASKIHVMARDDQGVYRFSRSHPGVGDLKGSQLTDVDGDGKKDLFLFGKSHFWWYPLRADDFALEERQLYETDLKDAVYADLIVGQLDKDGRDDVVVFDNNVTNVMEVLLANDPAKGEAPLRSALHFKLFEVDPHFQGQRGGRIQPHASVLADLNADGRADIAVLMHDRMVIYPQQ